MDPKYVTNRQGKDYVLYAGLLNAAHEKGLKRVTTKLLQIPGPENGHVAICFAEVETDAGFFTGHGDASPENVGKMVANALIRMAETRAKARAFRDALNVGELLADDPTDDHEETPTAPIRPPGVATNGAARVNADLRPRPTPVVHEPWPQDDAPHPADTEARPTPIRQIGTAGGPPATDKQIKTAEGLLKRAHRPPPEDLTTMSRAAVSELISDLIGTLGSLGR